MVRRRGWDDIPEEHHSTVFKCFSLPDAASFGATNKANQGLMSELMHTRVVEQISTFELPVRDTLNFMKVEGIVMSGSVVTGIVKPADFEANDMDIYVPRGSMDRVHQFLARVLFVHTKLRPTTRDTYDTGDNDTFAESGEPH